MISARDAYGFVFVVLAMLIMAYSSLFSVFPILIFYALCTGQVMLRGLGCLKPSLLMLVTCSLPVMACVSVLWSDYPAETLRSGIQFFTMAFCSWIMAWTVGTRLLIFGMVAGSFLVLLLSVLDGSYTMDYISHQTALSGLFPSKNQVGLWAQLTILMAILAWFVRVPLYQRIVFCGPSMLLALYSMVEARSKSSLISLVVVVGMLSLVYMVRILPKRYRGVSFLGTVFALGVSLASGYYFEVHIWIFEQLGKDPTLTGRTELWEEAIRLGQDRPWLGGGYGAFWVHGNYPAEVLWQEFYIDSKTGFHFHNVYLQAFVELGLVGVGLLGLQLIYNGYQVSRNVLKPGASIESWMLFGWFVMLMVRSIVEVDFLGVYGIGSLLFFMTLPRLHRYRKGMSPH